jgi:hypothetical protein
MLLPPKERVSGPVAVVVAVAPARVLGLPGTGALGGIAGVVGTDGR